MGLQEELQRSVRKCLKMMESFVIWIVLVVSWVYAICLTHQIVHFKYVQFIIVNYISRKMLKNGKGELEGKIPVAFGALQCDLFIKIVM